MQYKLRGGGLAVTGGTGRRCRAAHAAGSVASASATGRWRAW